MRGCFYQRKVCVQSETPGAASRSRALDVKRMTLIYQIC
jgi:hypothetical protein